MPKFGEESLKQLETCDARLIHLFLRVVETADCKVLEGHRDPQRQIELYNKKLSRVMVGKHNTVPSLAVDVTPYPINWKSINRFYYFGGYVLGIAEIMGIPIRWGGDWNRNFQVNDQDFNDLVHFELLDT